MEDTLKAINDLKNCYPFTTGLLIYCLIERELVYFIMSERKRPDPRLSMNHKANDKVKILRLYKDYDDESFLNEFIGKITLGNMAKIIILKEINLHDITKHRNEYMHSKNLVGSRTSNDYNERHSQHKNDLNDAIQDLKNVFSAISNEYKILEADFSG